MRMQNATDVLSSLTDFVSYCGLSPKCAYFAKKKYEKIGYTTIFLTTVLKLR